MSAKVTLKVIEGKFTGKEFTFKKHNSYIVGRAKDCNLKFPDKQRAISRHHCILDVNPPDIQVRDLGSKTGTYVNGKKIGQRDEEHSVQEGVKLVFPEYDLKNGDELKLADTLFRVGIDSPVVSTQKCTKCGKEVSNETGSLREGKYICRSCRNDPSKIMQQLLEQASAGENELVAIQGYSIIKEIGRGGMGAVYLARHEETGLEVALKVMLPQVAANKDATRKFLREAYNTQALEHRNIVQVENLGCSNGTFFLTLEFCDRGTIKDLMRRNGGPVSIDVACKIMIQALAGLEYAHRAEIPYVELKDGTIGKGRGLVHRDIKPGNIFLSGNTAKVADFGLAKAFETAGLSGHTRTGTAAGTPFFMPRQQVVNFKYSKPAVDVWAIAASLYYMLTGTYPRNFLKNEDVWQTVLQTDPVPIRQRKSSIPPKLAEVIDAALVDKPSIQIKSATELKLALESVL